MTQRLEVKAQVTAEATGEITGIAWPYGTEDRVGDVIQKGAFAGSANLPILWAHDQAEAIGVWDQITDTPEGLTVKGRLLVDDVAKAREVHALIRAGAVTGLSVGFVTKSSQPRGRRGRTITAAELHEISVVAVPAHPGARVTTLKKTPTIENGDQNPMENEDLNQAQDAPKVANAPQIDTKALDKITQRLDQLEAKAQRPGVTTTGAGNPIMGDDERKSFINYIRTGVMDMDMKALNVSSPTSGGVLAPESTSKGILEKVLELSPLRGQANIIQMGGPLLQLPVLVDEVEPQDRAESAAMAEDEPSFTQISLQPHEMAVTVPLTRVMLEDAHMDLNAYLTDHIARRFGKREAGWFINGNGTTQAEGILTNTQLAEIEAEAAGLSDALIDTFYGIKTAYSSRGAWLMTRKAMGIVRKLRDSDGAFLWQQSLAAGQPGTLLGRPVYAAEDMPEPVAGGVFAVFGDFHSCYTIADHVNLSILRDDYTGASNGIVKLHARRRVGGRVVMPEAAIKLSLAA